MSEVTESMRLHNSPIGMNSKMIAKLLARKDRDDEWIAEMHKALYYYGIGIAEKSVILHGTGISA